MEILFNVKEFYDTLCFASASINKKNSLPILDDVRLEIDAENKRVKMTGSDMDMQVSLYATLLEADGDFVVCINAQRLKDILSKLTDKCVRLTFNGDTSEVQGKHDSGRFTMTFDDANQYPSIDRPFNEPLSVTLDSTKQLYNALNAVAIGMADDQLRVVMNGVLLDFKRDAFVTVATDGKMLLKYSDTGVILGNEASFIMPKNTCNVLRTLLQRADTNVTIMFDDKHATITTPDFVCSFRQIEGRYPNYDGVIPQTFASKAEVARTALIDAISRMMVFAGTQEAIAMDFAPTAVTLSSSDVDYSLSAQESVACTFDANAFKIGMRGTLLQAALRNISSNDVRFSFVDERHGCIVEACDDASLITLIMPMMI